MSLTSRYSPSEAPQGAPVHYLRPSTTVWSPPSVIFLDSETSVLEVGETEILGLRLWSAQHVDRRDIRKSQGPVTWGRGTTPAALGEWLAERCRGRKTVWLYTHNLTFDLCTTALPLTMTALGYQVGDFSVRSTAPWLRLGNGRTVLTVCDSWSWLPEALGTIAARLGVSKEPLPGQEDDEATWYARCDRDVDIMATAILDLMDWWDRERLGRWSISGPASGWNMWRKMDHGLKVLVDPTPSVLASDRAAIRGGRRDVQVVGDLGRGHWVEVDFEAAHATVAATLPLPYRRGTSFEALPLDAEDLDSDRWGFIAEVEIRTESPRYPMRWGGVTWYPVGHFRTTLASPEVAWARDNGDLVAIGPGTWHQLGWHLQDWGGVILDYASGRAPDTPAVAQLAARHWGRAVLGKFAARTQHTEPQGDWPGADWGYQDGWDHDHECRGAFVTMAGRRWWAMYDQEGENSYPGVLAFVESHVRTRLGRLLDWLPQGCWVVADTDGVILDMADGGRLVRRGLDMRGRTRDAWGVAAQLCQLAQPITAPLVARPKREHREFRILGAQHLITDVDRRLSGIRRDAVETGPWTFKSREWPKLRWQMAHGQPGQYHRPERRPKLRRPTAHRWITEDGQAWSPWAEVTPQGESVLVPWERSWAAVVDAPLASVQYRGFDRLQG